MQLNVSKICTHLHRAGACIALCIVMSCSNLTPSTVGDTETLDGLKAMTHKGVEKDSQKAATSIRFDALRETGLSVGAQAGLADAGARFNEMLERNHAELDQAFNFIGLILDDNVLPPVLTESKQTVSQPNDTTFRLSGTTYKIEQEARFVSSPPTWRDYLLLHFTPPERPDASLLPRTRNEQKIWQEYIEKGWIEGIQQANTIYANNLARLKRDFNGMILYHKLYNLRMVSKPFVAQTDLGVTGGGKELTIDDKVLRITSLPRLDARTDNWDPAVAK